MLLSTGDGMESEPSSSSLQPCRRFQFTEIQQATNDFDESLVIGRGGFGKVYKGNVFNGSDVVVAAAIKRLDSSSDQGAPEFWTEVENLSRLRHNNIVSLIGYCYYENEMIVVYEYISDGTLNDHLHKLGTALSWLQRLNICIGAARGLDYLHTGQGIIHRDVKSSNILLQESLEAKITDFGLSKADPMNQPSTYVRTGLKGTFGYLDPEYFYTGKLTRKSDVYSFGIVLLEVLCRRPAIDTTLDEDQWGLARWAQEHIKKVKLVHIIDSDIRGQISPKCLREFVRIAVRCLHNNTKQRCTMAEVVVGLESVLTLQENINNPLQPAGETVFSRMVGMLQLPSRMVDTHPVPSEKENSASSEHSYKEFEPASSSSSLQACHHFGFPEIRHATSDFDESLVIGHGGSGKVYFGNIINVSGSVVAVAIKRLRSTSGQGAVQFWAEVNILRNFQHRNIVSLIGYCHDGKEMLLVYEYIPNGTLGDHLHTHGTPLSWLQRLNICIGAAHGLLHLHTHTGVGIVDGAIHHDVKSLNILLSESWEAKISDFGLSEIDPMDKPLTYANTTITGTFGYLDPACSEVGRLTKKSDVYAFGVVLLEVLCRRPALDTSLGEENPNLARWAQGFLCRRLALDNSLDEEDANLARWAQRSIKKGNVKHIVDPAIRDQISRKCLKKFVQIVERCLQGNPKHRSTMAEVVAGLESILTLQKKFNNSLQPQNNI
ncbi:hypothetical protein OSB04_014748 [Centaurea solstitialis]|uniref:Protein kinase domain-containing protein n=1 Tax=Centaurea solstitialis TaxID=347529 RepID=A0AA38THK1_9ASTR|nr:hypothetical protein OSB04_014748 [Centaurea solstitialis]